MTTKIVDVVEDVVVATDPDAEARDAALMMLLHRHGGSLRIDAGTVARLGKQRKALKVVYDTSTGETYVKLAGQEA